MAPFSQFDHAIEHPKYCHFIMETLCSTGGGGTCDMSSDREEVHPNSSEQYLAVKNNLSPLSGAEMEFKRNILISNYF